MLMLFILGCIRNASSVFSNFPGGGGFDYRLAMAIPDKWIQVRFNVNFFFPVDTMSYVGVFIISLIYFLVLIL